MTFTSSDGAPRFARALAMTLAIALAFGATACGKAKDASLDTAKRDASGWPTVFPKIADGAVLSFHGNDASFMMDFSAPGSPTEVYAFYKAQLTAQGWRVAGEEDLGGGAIKLVLDPPAKHTGWIIMGAEPRENGRSFVEMKYGLDVGK